MKYRNNTISCRPFLIITIILTLTACRKEWFDIKSDKTLTVPSTLQDFQQLLDNYRLFNTRTPGLGEVAADGKYTSESRWSSLYLNATVPLIQAQANAFTWSQLYVIDDSREWLTAYNAILTCNVVLDGLNSLFEKQNSNEYKQVKGSAQFFRAKTYFDLAQIYAEPFDPLHDSEYGLQIKESIDVTTITPRSSVHETYNFIISSLKESAQLLPPIASKPTRPSKLSSWALLSRVHLVMGNFESSKIYADSVISLSSGLLNYSDISNNSPIFPTFNKEIIFLSTSEEYVLTYATTTCFVDTAFYNSYSTDDARKKVYFEKRAGNYIYVGSYTRSITLVPFSGIGLNEIYLNRAEANSQLNKLDSALVDIKSLLINRYFRKEDGSTRFIMPILNGKNEILEFIYNERKKELPFRGLRWMDLRRQSIDISYKETITRNINGNTYTLEPSSYKFTLPIPNIEIKLSSIKQNPGWDK